MRDKDRERERQRHRWREKQAPWQDPDAGLDPGTPGSCPGPKAGAKPLSHPGIQGNFLNYHCSGPYPVDSDSVHLAWDPGINVHLSIFQVILMPSQC